MGCTVQLLHRVLRLITYKIHQQWQSTGCSNSHRGQRGYRYLRHSYASKASIYVPRDGPHFPRLSNNDDYDPPVGRLMAGSTMITTGGGSFLFCMMQLLFFFAFSGPIWVGFHSRFCEPISFLPWLCFDSVERMLSVHWVSSTEERIGLFCPGLPEYQA